MSSYKELHKRAERLGLNLWQNGGYYYLSGFIRGKHRQGSFDTLKEVEAQLSDEARYQKSIQQSEKEWKDAGDYFSTYATRKK